MEEWWNWPSDQAFRITCLTMGHIILQRTDTYLIKHIEWCLIMYGKSVQSQHVWRITNNIWACLVSRHFLFGQDFMSTNAGNCEFRCTSYLTDLSCQTFGNKYIYQVVTCAVSKVKDRETLGDMLQGQFSCMIFPFLQKKFWCRDEICPCYIKLHEIQLVWIYKS